MTRYIDAKKVEETKTIIYGLLQEFIDESRIYSTSSIDYHGGRADGVETARTMVIRRLNTLLEQPTADVQEVKYGKWELKSEIYQLLDDVDEQFYVECSLCHRAEYVPFEFEDEKMLEYAKEHYPYCHCGAKMDGGK